MKHVSRILPLIVVVLVLAGALAIGPSVVERFAFAATKGAHEADREELARLSQREQLSKLFRTVARVVSPAVVEVRVEERVRMRERDLEDFFRRFFREGPFDDLRPGPMTPQRERPQQRFYTRRKLGSGVIVDAEAGYVLTNYHVVLGADKVKIVTHDDREFVAEWIRKDIDTDLAVLKIKDPEGLVGAPLGDSDAMEVGDWVLAIGSPEGLQQTVTAGIISAKGRITRQRAYENFLQTDAAINHGNSGGPLVNMRGQVIGINTAIVSRTGVNEGIGLAIPAKMAKNVMRQLIERGEVVRGYLGVYIRDLDQELAESFGLDSPNGALVVRLIEGGPAIKAGILEEDIILAIDGEPVKDVNELRHRVADMKPGKEVAVTVYRNGQKKTVKVKIATRSSELARAGEAPPGQERPKRYGLEVQTLTDELARRYGYDEGTKGVLITDVDPDSDAADEGVMPGMVITRVGRKDVATAKDFARAVAAAGGKKIRLRLLGPDGLPRYVVLSQK